MDRYLLAKTREYVAESTRQLDAYAVADACDTTQRFLDVLSNWYIRRSRERFWAAEGNPRRPRSTLSTRCWRSCAG
jgi:isoleucyl-tRNA synthetase